MPIIWYAKDGKRPHSQQGPGTPVTLAEAEKVIVGKTARFAGSVAPNINPENPSASVRNVVVELLHDEGQSVSLPEPGFYLIVGLSPEHAERRLALLRTLQAKKD